MTAPGKPQAKKGGKPTLDKMTKKIARAKVPSQTGIRIAPASTTAKKSKGKSKTA